MNFIAKAWKGVTGETIERCFKKAGFFVDDASLDDDDEVEEIINALDDFDENDWRLLGGTGVTFREFVDVDKDLATTNMIDVEEIIVESHPNLDNTLEPAESDVESEDDMPTPPVPTFRAALDGFETFQSYMLCHPIDEETQNNLISMYSTFIQIHNKATKKQSKISDFFSRPR